MLRGSPCNPTVVIKPPPELGVKHPDVPNMMSPLPELEVLVGASPFSRATRWTDDFAAEHVSIVIPAKAGIQSVNGVFLKACRIDSRPSPSTGQAFRENDSDFERPRLANATSTGFPGLRSIQAVN